MGRRDLSIQGVSNETWSIFASRSRTRYDRVVQLALTTLSLITLLLLAAISEKRVHSVSYLSPISTPRGRFLSSENRSISLNGSWSVNDDSFVYLPSVETNYRLESISAELPGLSKLGVAEFRIGGSKYGQYILRLQSSLVSAIFETPNGKRVLLSQSGVAGLTGEITVKFSETGVVVHDAGKIIFEFLNPFVASGSLEFFFLNTPVEGLVVLGGRE